MKQNEIFYDEFGAEIDVEATACAKKITYEETSVTQFFVKFTNGGLFNPHQRFGFDQSRRKMREVRFKKTNEPTFLLYLKYLRTRNNSALLQAQREMGG